MKIAYIISSMANAGPINVVRDLVKVMTENGHQVDVYYFSEIGLKDFDCTMIKISLYSKFDWNSYDVVHTHGGRPDLFVFLRKPLHWKGKLFTTIHSFIFEDHYYKYGRILSKLTSQIILFLTRRHDKVIVLSKVALDYYRQYIKSSKLTYAYNTRRYISMPIDAGDKNKISGFVNNFKNVLGSICSISERKGLEQILYALQDFPNVGFIIVGDGLEKKNLQILANKLDVSNQILFLGSRLHGERYLPYFDVFVIPSRSEGFPLSMLEAAAAGKAILSSDIPVFKEIFTDAEVAKFQLDNINSLKHQIVYALENRSELSQNITIRYNNDYSPERFYLRHLDIYTKQD